MGKRFAIAFTLLFSTFSYAAPHHSVQCNGLAPFKKPIYLAGGDQLLQIKSLEATLDETGVFYAAVKASVKTAIDQSNADIHREKLAPKDIIERFTVSKAISGTLMSLQQDKENTLNLGAIFLEIGQLNIVTAGPVPSGVFPVQTAFAFVASKYSQKNPMNIKKFIFNCNMKVAY